MVMCDGGKSGLRNELRDCKPQGKVQRNCDGVLHNQKFQRKTMGKFVKLRFEKLLQLIDSPRYLGGTDVYREEIFVQRLDLRVCGTRFFGHRPASSVGLAINGL